MHFNTETVQTHYPMVVTTYLINIFPPALPLAVALTVLTYLCIILTFLLFVCISRTESPRFVEAISGIELCSIIYFDNGQSFSHHAKCDEHQGFDTHLCCTCLAGPLCYMCSDVSEPGSCQTLHRCADDEVNNYAILSKICFESVCVCACELLYVCCDQIKDGSIYLRLLPV